MDAGLRAFLQNFKPSGGTLEKIPFLTALRDGKSVVLVARAPENQPIAEITRRCRLARTGKGLQLDRGIVEAVLPGFNNDRSFVMRTRHLDVVILWFMVAHKVIVKLILRPATARICKIILIQHIWVGGWLG